MTREDYAIRHLRELKKLKAKRARLNNIEPSQVSNKRFASVCADLSFTGMHIAQTLERINFALGNITPDECRPVFHISAMHEYRGIKEELENVKFDNEL